MLQRIAYESAGLKAVFDGPTKRAYGMSLLRNLPSILRTRKLTLADSGINDTVAITYRGVRFVFPLGEVNHRTRAHEITSAFGALREMYGHDVYLRGFARLPTASAALDLGANRGFFEPIAIKTLGAGKVIAIEPTAYYEPIGALLLDANGIDRSKVNRYIAFGGAADSEAMISITEAMRRSSVAHIDFCKMDIEGGEFPLFAADGLLPHIDVLSAELHPAQGDIGIIEKSFEAHGFTRRYSDQFGRRVGYARADYVCAARDASLIRQD